MLYFLGTLFAFALSNDGYTEHFLKYRRKNGMVDYSSLKADNRREEWLQALATSTEPSTKAGKLAFWINAYNALTLDLIADNYPLDSIMKLDNGSVWKTRKFTVAGKQVTLDEIENTILRPLGEPRIHAAINCASLGCPVLLPSAYEEETLSAQLDEAMIQWVKTNAYQFEGNKLLFNNIFSWYKADFQENILDAKLPKRHTEYAGIISFLFPYLSPEEQTRILKGKYEIGIAPYDWSLNTAD